MRKTISRKTEHGHRAIKKKCSIKVKKEKRNKAGHTASDEFSLVLVVALVKYSTFQDFNSCVTDGRMDRQTNGQTIPLIELRERI